MCSFDCYLCTTFCMREQLPHTPCMCVLTAVYVPVDCHICAFCMPGPMPLRSLLIATFVPIVSQNNNHTWATFMCLLIAISVPVGCHMWASCGPEQLPHMGHLCACSLPCMHLLTAIYVPVDCHMWASYLLCSCL